MENALSDFWTIYQQYDPEYEDTAEHIKEVCRKIDVKNLFNSAATLAAQAKVAWKHNGIGAVPSAFIESLKYYTCILLTEPDHKDALREFGGLYYDAKQFDNALQCWTRLLELEMISYHYYLCAVANKCLGNITAAKSLPLWDLIVQTTVTTRG